MEDNLKLATELSTVSEEARQGSGVFKCATVRVKERSSTEEFNLVPKLIILLLQFHRKPTAMSADTKDTFPQVKLLEVDQADVTFLLCSRVLCRQ